MFHRYALDETACTTRLYERMVRLPCRRQEEQRRRIVVEEITIPPPPPRQDGPHVVGIRAHVYAHPVRVSKRKTEEDT